MKRERTLPGKTLPVLTALLLICATLTAMTLPAFAIELKTGIGIVETSGLRLRAKPNTDCEILANASYGDSVVIIRDAGDFYLVDYNLQIGYMAKQYITFKERENIELGYANVIDSAVNMRSAPSSDGELLAQLTSGDHPYIIGFNCGWYKVTFGGDTGYIRSDLLELTQAPGGNSGGSMVEVVSLGQQVVDLAQNYLGYPYVWGGSTPSGGFDCSGFVSYVLTNSGLVNTGRLGAQGLYNISTPVSKANAQPGDLIFFVGTYDTPGVSHVGIYVGDGVMIHCGDPIQYTSINSSYWQQHFYAFGRPAY